MIYGETADYAAAGLVPAGLVVAGASFGFLVFMVIRDIVDLENSVNAYNQRHGFANLSITPTLFPCQEAAGLTLSLWF